ncbi:hypothetical protein KAFR_0C00390 [Kazachstania africana CBS 2517]|uniref:DNA repair and recombination protein RDH54 n=1 Tax=Kazachstania africana (strain ATCC 22294 / BCRC 22015 / CBS 2517 / CECT 1963 / NBRC 1671 / NRRL Y-8276) TaxID=1071382 RepID=H2ARN4_KAZAF|nr:hypothetical protein KAFR_0C00390 [Kazachstania africana CBS 2517]CCF57034.1 hypothetical protein KAFR_0C00390 [Kazachstania africana CBS 2517]
MNLPKYENKPFKPPRKLGTNVNEKRVRSTVVKEQSPKKKLNISTTNKKYFTTMYRKQTSKKHKTWENDGYAILTKTKLSLYNDNGKFISSVTVQGIENSIEDTIIKIGSLEFQLDHLISDSEELASFHELIQPSKSSQTASSEIPSQPKKIKRSTIPITKLFQSNNLSTKKSKKSVTTNLANSTASMRFKPIFDVSTIETPIIMNKSPRAQVDVIVDPKISKILRPHQVEGVKFMYDCIFHLDRSSSVESNEKNLVLNENFDLNGCILADEMGLGKTLMTISLIWTLLKQTPYPQPENCSQNGITLVGHVKKIIIVCPVTLIMNWRNEFAKWLNLNKIGILILKSSNSTDMDKNAIKNFLKIQNIYQVLILGYEKVLSVSQELISLSSNIDLIVCDEGHRLKNTNSKVLNILKELNVKSKILLSGTPIQNDLIEFFTIIDFINPDIIGSFNQFKKNYIVPITKARDVKNKFNENVIETGEIKSQELIDLTSKFILRRTNAILNKYLPPRTDIILFCKPTKEQLTSFDNILLGSNLNFQSLLNNSTSSLALITLFKKICNSPSLANSDPYYNKLSSKDHKQMPRSVSTNSGKLKVLVSLVNSIKKMNNPMEKIVIVSNYTQTLDLIEGLISSLALTFVRLDGSTPVKQRNSIVSSFNNDQNVNVFLLSAKSGGVGLNLIGGSRLILFDNDWNPSVDLQAMSRIHRDGQKKHCFIYRLITTGCIDEKILQRQLMKNNLSLKFLDNDTNNNSNNNNDDLFDKADLKDLFTVVKNSNSNTHDLICSCKGDGRTITFDEEDDNKASEDMHRLGTWNSASNAQRIIDSIDTEKMKQKSKFIKKCLLDYRHINPVETNEFYDDAIHNNLEELRNYISFAFVKIGTNSSI